MSYREFGLKGKLTPNSQKELHWLSLQVRQWYFAFYFLLSSSVCFLRNLCLCSACLSGQSVISVAQLCRTLCDLMDCSTPGFPVHHQLPELAQTHVHRVSDAIEPSFPLLSPSPPASCLLSGKCTKSMRTNIVESFYV